MAEPSSGSSGMIQRYSMGKYRALEFEKIHAFHVERSTVARCQNDDAKAHSRFRGRNNDDEEHKYFTLHLARGAAECRRTPD